MKKIIFTLFCILMLFSYKSNGSECINRYEPVASINLTTVKYIGENKGIPIVQIKEKKQLLNDRYYIIDGEVYNVFYGYGNLCFKQFFRFQEFVELDKLPEILTLYLYNHEDEAVNYIPFYEGKLYYLLDKVKFQNRFYIKLNNKYVELEEWLSIKKVKNLY